MNLNPSPASPKDRANVSVTPPFYHVNYNLSSGERSGIVESAIRLVKDMDSGEVWFAISFTYTKENNGFHYELKASFADTPHHRELWEAREAMNSLMNDLDELEAILNLRSYDPCELEDVVENIVEDHGATWSQRDL